jgi:hypothetical protein
VKVLTKPAGLGMVWGYLAGAPRGYRRCNKCHRICEALASKETGPRLEEMMAGVMGFRNLQHLMPYHELPLDGKTYLQTHLHRFTGHSKYTMQILLKVTDWSDNTQVDPTSLRYETLRELLTHDEKKKYRFKKH